MGRALPEPMMGEPSMKTCSKQTNTDPGREHGSDGFKITNPLSAKKTGSVGRETQIVSTLGTNDIFKMVTLMLVFRMPIPPVPINTNVTVQRLLNFDLLFVGRHAHRLTDNNSTINTQEIKACVNSM